MQTMFKNIVTKDNNYLSDNGTWSQGDDKNELNDNQAHVSENTYSAVQETTSFLRLPFKTSEEVTNREGHYIPDNIVSSNNSAKML